MYLPGDLERRGVSDAAVACGTVIDDFANTAVPTEAAPATDPDEVFDRLGDG